MHNGMSDQCTCMVSWTDDVRVAVSGVRRAFYILLAGLRSIVFTAIAATLLWISLVIHRISSNCRDDPVLPVSALHVQALRLYFLCLTRVPRPLTLVFGLSCCAVCCLSETPLARRAWTYPSGYLAVHRDRLYCIYSLCAVDREIQFFFCHML